MCIDLLLRLRVIFVVVFLNTIDYSITVKHV